MLRTASLLLALLLACPTWAFAQERSADGDTASFYRWYLTHSTGTQTPILSPEIKQFITARLAKKLRKAMHSNAMAEDPDYFLKVQDYDDADWQSHISTAEPVGNADTKHLLVSIGSAAHADLCVHVRLEDHRWKVDAVDPEDFPSAPAGCKTKITEGTSKN